VEVEVAPPTTTATGNGSAQLFARINHTATATTTANTCENKSNNSQKPGNYVPGAAWLTFQLALL